MFAFQHSSQKILHRLEFVNENFAFYIVRNIIKLKNPEAEILTQNELALLNTKYIPILISNTPMNNKVKRKELAYIINQIAPIEPTTKNITINDLKDINYKQSIQNVVNTKIFTLTNNNKFNENKTINLAAFLASISKAFKYKVNTDNEMDININKNSWFYPYVQIGLQKNIIITHTSLNDRTIEGIQSKDFPAFSVQYHPESSPGSHDSRYLFKYFTNLMRKNKKVIQHAKTN